MIKNELKEIIVKLNQENINLKEEKKKDNRCR